MGDNAMATQGLEPYERIHVNRRVGDNDDACERRGLFFAVEARNDANVRALEIHSIQGVELEFCEPFPSQKTLRSICISVWVLSDEISTAVNPNYHRIHSHYWQCLHTFRPWTNGETLASLSWGPNGYHHTLDIDLPESITVMPVRDRGVHIHVSGWPGHEGDVVKETSLEQVERVEGELGLPLVALQLTSTRRAPADGELLHVVSGYATFSLRPLAMAFPPWHWPNSPRHSPSFSLVGNVRYRVIPRIWSQEHRAEFGPNFCKVADNLLRQPTSQRFGPRDQDGLLVGHPRRCLTLLAEAMWRVVRGDGHVAATSSSANVWERLPTDCTMLILQMCAWDWFDDIRD